MQKPNLSKGTTWLLGCYQNHCQPLPSKPGCELPRWWPGCWEGIGSRFPRELGSDLGVIRVAGPQGCELAEGRLPHPHQLQPMSSGEGSSGPGPESPAHSTPAARSPRDEVPPSLQLLKTSGMSLGAHPRSLLRQGLPPSHSSPRMSPPEPCSTSGLQSAASLPGAPILGSPVDPIGVCIDVLVSLPLCSASSQTSGSIWGSEGPGSPNPTQPESCFARRLPLLCGSDLRGQ